MHVKLTYSGDGRIDVEAFQYGMIGGEVSNLLEAFKKIAPDLVVERFDSSGKPLGNPEVYGKKRKGTS